MPALYFYSNKKNALPLTTRSGQKSAEEYDSYDNLTSYKQPGRDASVKRVMTYGGTSQQKRHLLESATTPPGVKTQYKYDSYGSSEKGRRPVLCMKGHLLKGPLYFV